MRKRIISLNLVILMILLSLQPVYAGEIASANNKISNEVMVDIAGRLKLADTYAVSLDKDEYVLSDNDKLSVVCNEDEYGVSLLSSNAVYSIHVGDIDFKSDKDAEGNGWKYAADDGVLTLNGYNGETIKSDGDLYVETEGNVKIVGNASDYGIYANGDLTLFILNGSVNVKGGSGIGSYEGKPAVSASGSVYIENLSDSNSYFYGGDAVSADAGDAIRSGMGTDDEIMIYEDYGIKGKLYINGGKSTNNYCGSGLYGGNVYVLCDSVIYGNSNDYYTIVGIYYEYDLAFGINEVTVNTGNGNDNDWWAIAGGDGSYRYSGDHTKISISENSIYTSAGKETVGYRVVIKVNKYTLVLDGDGGTYNGRSSVSFTDRYLYNVNLSDYVFSIDKGYIQVNWRSASSSQLIPLAYKYYPDCNETLKAEWLVADKGDTVLNAVIGEFDNGKCYKKYTSEKIELKDSIKTESSNILTGWRNNVSFKYEDGSDEGHDCNYICKYEWYAPESTYCADENKINQLYADYISEEQNSGGIRYHAGEGKVKSGGNIIMQQVVDFDDGVDSVKVNAPSARKYLQDPEGYKLAGWTDIKGSSVVKYKNKAEVSLKKGKVLDFYAIWTPNITESDIQFASGKAVYSISASYDVSIDDADEVSVKSLNVEFLIDADVEWNYENEKLEITVDSENPISLDERIGYVTAVLSDETLDAPNLVLTELSINGKSDISSIIDSVEAVRCNESNDVAVTVNIGKGYGEFTGKVFICAYNANGKMVNKAVESTDFSGNEMLVKVTLENCSKTADYVKVFFTDDSYKPLNSGKQVIII